MSLAISREVFLNGHLYISSFSHIDTADLLFSPSALMNSDWLMLTQQIAENASKITYLDQILQSQDTVTVSQVAADYGLSAMKLNKILKEEKVQYKVNNQWLLYSKHQNRGYTRSKTVDVVHTDGRRSLKMNSRWK